MSESEWPESPVFSLKQQSGCTRALSDSLLPPGSLALRALTQLSREERIFEK